MSNREQRGGRRIGGTVCSKTNRVFLNSLYVCIFRYVPAFYCCSCSCSCPCCDDDDVGWVSVSFRYCIKSAMLVKTYPCFFPNRTSSGRRAIPVGFSSDTISQITPQGLRPASRARSTDASVWPSLVKTPPSRDRSGNMCPGRTMSVGFVFMSANKRAVMDRSSALIPVDTPLDKIEESNEWDPGQDKGPGR